MQCSFHALVLLIIVARVMTYTFVLLCECMKFVLTEAQETNGFLCYKEAQTKSLCYKCPLIFGFYYKPLNPLAGGL